MVSLKRAAGDLLAGGHPHAGTGFGGELGERFQADPPPFDDPVGRPDPGQTPDRRLHRGGLPGEAAVLIVTLSPASARLIAVVRPLTPAPITRTSMT